MNFRQQRDFYHRYYPTQYERLEAEYERREKRRAIVGALLMTLAFAGLIWLVVRG